MAIFIFYQMLTQKKINDKIIELSILEKIDNS